jgi:hypothetical protein
MQPWSASFRKQMRQVPNLRYTARGRPQSMQRRTIRVENFGFRWAAAILDLLAMVSSVRAAFSIRYSVGQPGGRAEVRHYAAASPSFLRGIPIATRNCLASSSVRAVVTKVMFIPCGRLNLSGLISGNTICSESPRL